MSKPLVLYHADCDDGFGAAFAAWLKLGDEATYHPVHHGDRVATQELQDRDVFVLDFSFAPVVMGEMARHARSITVLDHHKSAQLEWASVEPEAKVKVLFDMQRSGAQMAWDHFHPQSARPALIDHIGDRDLWRFALPDTKAFCAGLSLLPADFKVWQLVMQTPAELLDKGKVVLQVLQRQIDGALNKDLRSVTLCGHTGLATNAISNTSELGNAIALRSGTFSLTFFIKGDDVVCSLRSIAPFDVSVIAAHYGGGGHAQASGFRVSVAKFFSDIWR